MRSCTECDHAHHARGLCQTHYSHWIRSPQTIVVRKIPKGRPPTKKQEGPKQVNITVQELMCAEYTLDFEGAGIVPPLIPTVNCPASCSMMMLKALRKKHPAAPFVTTWHRDSEGEVEIRCLAGTIPDMGAWAKEYYNGDGTEEVARFHVSCQTISL